MFSSLQIAVGATWINPSVLLWKFRPVPDMTWLLTWPKSLPHPSSLDYVPFVLFGLLHWICKMNYWILLFVKHLQRDERVFLVWNNKKVCLEDSVSTQIKISSNVNELQNLKTTKESKIFNLSISLNIVQTFPSCSCSYVQILPNKAMLANRHYWLQMLMQR